MPPPPEGAQTAPPAAAPPDHTIRLRGPWEWRPDGGTRDDTVTVSLPHAAATAGVLARRFNAPTGLDDGTRVRLRVELDGAGEVTLDGAAVVPGADVTAALSEPGRRCVLTVRLPAGGTLRAAGLDLFEPRYAY